MQRTLKAWVRFYPEMGGGTGKSIHWSRRDANLWGGKIVPCTITYDDRKKRKATRTRRG